MKRLELKNNKFSLSRHDSHITSSVPVYPDNSEPAAGNVTVCQTQQFTPAMLFGTRPLYAIHCCHRVPAAISQLLEGFTFTSTQKEARMLLRVHFYFIYKKYWNLSYL